ncbi:MAG: threonine-phosphate decarboxylase CobD [Cyanobacteriota bacterium]|nr:threonine-phosphate decarboxylase CobD [Cyanobacteriota bacterium]
MPSLSTHWDSQRDPEKAPLPPRHGGNRDWAAQLAHCSASAILDFSANLNPFGLPDSVRQALQKALADPLAAAVSLYPDPSSCLLRQALSDFYGVDPDWLIVGNGAAELLTWAAREAAQTQATVLPVPAFPDYQRALLSAGASVVLLPLNWLAGSHPVGSLSDLLDPWLKSAPLSRTLWLNNPHNPTGYLWRREEILPLIPLFERVVVDEAFMDFLPPAPRGNARGSSQSLLQDVPHFPQLIVVRSLTKFYALAGLRIGFAVGHPAIWQRWQQWRDPWSVNGLATIAAQAALADHAYQQQTYDWIPSARQHLYAGLAQLPGCRPLASSANFILTHTSASSLELQRFLLQTQQILIRDCTSFSGLGSHYFRVAVRTIGDHQRLLEGCQQFLAL